MMSKAIFWFRRDLRLTDNSALYHCLKENNEVTPIFIFDKLILDELPANDKRVRFIYNEIKDLKAQLNKIGSDLLVYYGEPIKIISSLLDNADKIYANHDYELYAKFRDNEIKKIAKEKSVEFITFKDQVIFEKDEILKDDGKPYTVFTPYSKKFKAKLNDEYLKSFTTEDYFQNFVKSKPSELISLEIMGFDDFKVDFPNKYFDNDLIKNYHNLRNFPAENGTSRLSVHLRFGTISIRELFRTALELNETFTNELIWREFYMMILWHFPYIDKSFKPQYDNIEWLNNSDDFAKWKEGKTGYPIVDAGMRELNETGYMHNRVRMIVASFLTKHLLIDWRWGEAYFAEKLLDFELSSNNGGWQWAAGCGCDAAPYFRVFNPSLQTIKFDEKLEYVKKWVPEFDNPFIYPKPMIEHNFARDRALKHYKFALNK